MTVINCSLFVQIHKKIMIMDIMVTHVYDKYRFAYYMEAKFKMNKMAAITMANDINHGYAVKLCDLPECDVKYLQKTGYHCNYENPGICDLKMLNNNMKNRPSIPPYCDNERKYGSSCWYQ